MKWIIFPPLIFLIFISHSAAESLIQINYVKANTLNVRQGPSVSSSKTGVLFLGQPVVVHTFRDKWSRVESVEKKTRGWVYSDYLSDSPLSAAQKAQANRELIRAIIKDSDDFDLYEEQFLKTAVELIDSGRCSFSNLKEMRGWWYSKTSVPQYFVYCGTKSRKQISLNPITGRINN